MSGIYSKITKYIKPFEDGKFGDWSEEKIENDVRIMPQVHYSDTVRNFIKDLYDLINDDNDNVSIDSYNKQYNKINNIKSNLDKANSEELVYFIFSIVRRERFCDGLLLDYLKAGTITKCLKKLKEFDDNGFK